MQMGHCSKIGLCFSLMLLATSGCRDRKGSSGQGVVEVVGTINEDTTWTAANEYLLVGQVFVDEGTTLTIEPGTTIKSIPADSAGLAPLLVIKPGAKILAEGTAEKPITFTSSADASELPQRGLWGGVIVLGRAPVNVAESKRLIEGISGIYYGGTDENDNSGVLKYVRIWYGGRVIGNGNEINGLTLGGVGRGTTVEHVEVAWNDDDGFEFFGGTVDVKYLSALYCRDDSFDVDLGYSGRMQFLFSLSGRDYAGRAMEMDNDGSSGTTMDAKPRSFPQVCNATLIGPGVMAPEKFTDSSDRCTAYSDQTDYLIRLREGVGGDFRNMVVMSNNPNYYLRPAAGTSYKDEKGSAYKAQYRDDAACIRIDIDLKSKKFFEDRVGSTFNIDFNDSNCSEYVQGDDPSGKTNGLLTLTAPTDLANRELLYISSKNNFFDCVRNSGASPADANAITTKNVFHKDIVKHPVLGGTATTAQSKVLSLDPQLVNFRLGTDNKPVSGTLDPRPASASPVLQSGNYDSCRSDGWFENPQYAGAFNATENWLSGWSWLNENGYMD